MMISSSKIVGTEWKASAMRMMMLSEPPAGVARDQPQADAEDKATGEHRRRGDDDGGLSRPDDARQQVAAQLVRAQRMVPAWAPE